MFETSGLGTSYMKRVSCSGACKMHNITTAQCTSGH